MSILRENLSLEFFCKFSKERFQNSSDTRARPGDSSQEIEDPWNVSKQFGKPPSQSSEILVLQELRCSPYVQTCDAGANLPYGGGYLSSSDEDICTQTTNQKKPTISPSETL